MDIPALRTWSEQNDPFSPNHSWRDCSQCTYLMLLLFGGVTIPNRYTVSERERFEDNEGLPEYNPTARPGTVQETGLLDYSPADTAALKLYGAQAVKGSETDLPAQLNSTDVALGLSGIGVGLPSGYTGAHSVCFVPQGNGQVWVYDPMRLMGDGPETATAAAILAWHQRLPNDIRLARVGELTPQYPPRSASMYTSIAPTRILDSRIALGLPGKLAANLPTLLQVTGKATVPPEATAITGNLTATQADSRGWLAGSPVVGVPTTSNVNLVPGDDRANGFTLGLDTNGRLTLFATAPTHVCLDVTGYFTPDSPTP